MMLSCPPPLCKSNALTVDFPGSQGGSLPFYIQQQEIFLAVVKLGGTVTAYAGRTQACLKDKQPLCFSRQTS